MDKSIIGIFLFSIPECLLIIYIAYGLIGCKLNLKICLTISTILSILTEMIRSISGNYIFNVFIHDFIFIALFCFFKVSTIFKSTIAVLLSTSIYLLIEFFNVKILTLFFNINFAAISNQPYIYICCFIPQLLLAIILGFFINHYGFSIFISDEG